MISPELAQYGITGVAIAQLILIWYLISKIIDVLITITSSVTDAMRLNTTALEGLRMLITERLPPRG